MRVATGAEARALRKEMEPKPASILLQVPILSADADWSNAANNGVSAAESGRACELDHLSHVEMPLELVPWLKADHCVIVQPVVPKQDDATWF